MEKYTHQCLGTIRMSRVYRQAGEFNQEPNAVCSYAATKYTNQSVVDTKCTRPESRALNRAGAHWLIELHIQGCHAGSIMSWGRHGRKAGVWLGWAPICEYFAIGTEMEKRGTDLSLQGKC